MKSNLLIVSLALFFLLILKSKGNTIWYCWKTFSFTLQIYHEIVFKLKIRYQSLSTCFDVYKTNSNQLFKQL